MVKDIMIKKHQLKQFLDSHKDCYSNYEIKRILDYSEDFKTDVFLPDLVREIYDELGFVSDEHNIYLGFMELLKEAFPSYSERNILEIGGGILPRLGKKISNIQTTGKITIYDPRLSVYEKDAPNFKLVRQKFSRNDSVGDHNLMIGFMPCEGAEILIDSATKNNMDFMLAFCEGGPHGDEFDYFEDANEWLHSMMYLAERNVKDHRMGKVKVKSLKEYGDPYPVIYNDRNK